MEVALKILGLFLLFNSGQAWLDEDSSPVFRASKMNVKYKHLEAWNDWKMTHSKNYSNTHEELLRHLTWLSNMKYIAQHNANAHIFGFTLKMNHLGDVVCKKKLYSD